MKYSKVKDIKVTIIHSTGGEFCAVFEAAYSAFIALHTYLQKDSRCCYYTDNYDELMESLMSLRYGASNKFECSMFRAEAIDREDTRHV